MNNNFYDIPIDWYRLDNNYMNQINKDIPDMFNMNNNMMNDLSNPKIALERGNLFNNLYDSYKNYRYRELRPSNKREELLIDILRHNFVLTELNLYLDVNPRDINMVNLYNRYLDNKKKIVMEYERQFGPLTLDGLNVGANEWNWDKMPWPWEGTK